jgi:hypothetical protein
MFEPGVSGCAVDDALGSDVDKLRVTGAMMFALRTAHGEPSPKDRIGAVSMGGEVDVVYPLTPIDKAREGVVAAVENPKPKGGTNVIDALNAAYDELIRDPQPTQTPAIVFLTDGVPYPSEGQSFTEIERLVREYPTIPLYVLLLQNQDVVIPEYQEYIRKWRQFQQRVTNVRVYEVRDEDDLLSTYNTVIADIAGRPPGIAIETIESGESRDFYISQYAQKVQITAIYPDKEDRGSIEVRDRSGQAVTAEDPGVTIYSDQDTPIEVYTAQGVRLEGQTGGDWSVVSVNARVSFFVDVRGAYRFDWLSPAMTLGTLPGVVQMEDEVHPRSELRLRFQFVDEAQKTILDKQRVSGYVITPDGVEQDLHTTPEFEDGVYTLPFQIAQYSSDKSSGRYEMYLQSEDPKQGQPSQAIAVQRVWIEADPDAQIVTPTPSVATATTKPTNTPTVMPTTTVTPTASISIPTDGNVIPSTSDPFQRVLTISFFVILGLGGLYLLLRLLIKSPQGFVMIVGDIAKSPQSIKRKASRKLWGWWKLTVGPKGDLRLRDKSNSDAGLSGGNAGYGAPAGGAEVQVPGMGQQMVAAAEPDSQKGKRKKKKYKVYGYFYRDREKTKFRCEYGPSKGRRTLSSDTVDVVNFGDVQLQICLKREKLNSGQS